MVHALSNGGGNAEDVDSLMQGLPENSALSDTMDRLNELPDNQLRGILGGTDEIAIQAAAVILWKRNPRKPR